MIVNDIIRDWLVAHQCDGLCDSGLECGCNLDDFMPCDELNMECEAARQGEPPDSARDDFDFWMYPIAIETIAQLRADYGKMARARDAAVELLKHLRDITIRGALYPDEIRAITQTIALLSGEGEDDED